ncbi:unnamed protein product [Mytilus coruscus]|uniref:C-type lectin domain-containing protein n=1 Tax=Mytilus coruscus TaxID=42192 RepID=A0A6J8CBP1_MYTCO|nr:unnamed protein product [Mytilus coruscus]
MLRALEIGLNWKDHVGSLVMKRQNGQMPVPPVNHSMENLLFYLTDKSDFILLIQSACQSCHGEFAILSDRQILLLFSQLSLPVNHSIENSACQSFHGELAVLPDRQILTSVTDGLLRHTHGDKFWLDGSDIITEGDWLWNSNLQPIDLQMLGVSISDNEKDKNCLYIDRDNHNRWKAESCESDAYYICQHRYMSIKIIKSFIKCMQKRKLL